MLFWLNKVDTSWALVCGNRKAYFLPFRRDTGFTDKTINQNVRLLGCVNKRVKTVKIVVVAPDL
jgi:hypothetical protein